MKFFKGRCEIEMLGGCGSLQVNIRPVMGPAFYLEIATLAVILLFGWKTLPATFHDHPIDTTCFFAALLSTLWYQITGSEEIEFDPQRLVVRKNLAWGPQTREYRLDTCDALEVLDEKKDGPDRFSLNAAGRTVSFGRNLSVEQAYKVLDELKKALPDVSYRLLQNGDYFSKRLTLLNLR
jgi:uncharacterized membrane protein